MSAHDVEGSITEDLWTLLTGQVSTTGLGTTKWSL